MYAAYTVARCLAFDKLRKLFQICDLLRRSIGFLRRGRASVSAPNGLVGLSIESTAVIYKSQVSAVFPPRKGRLREGRNDKRPILYRRASAAEQVCELSLVPVIARCLTGHAMEHDGEVAVAGTADPVRDLGDRQIRSQEQRFRPLDPALENKPMGWKSGGLPERMREMPRTHCQSIRNVGKRDVLAEVAVDVFERALQLALRQRGQGLLRR
jgi:hypothetical protein